MLSSEIPGTDHTWPNKITPFMKKNLGGSRGVLPFVVNVKSTYPILRYLRGGYGGGPAVVEDLVRGVDYNISHIIVKIYPMFHPGSGQL